jgi:hypothetical protein
MAKPWKSNIHIFSFLLSPTLAMSAREAMAGNLLAFGRIVLKYVVQTHLSFSHQHQRQQQYYTRSSSKTTEVEALFLSSDSMTLPFLTSLFLPEPVKASEEANNHVDGEGQAAMASSPPPQPLRPFPTLASSSPTVKPLSPHSLNGHFSATAVHSWTSVMFFPGICHRSGYFVFFPDPAADLVLDMTSQFEGALSDDDYVFQDPDDCLNDLLNIYIFEEDEPPPRRTWTLTIPRPPDSIALPKPKMRLRHDRGHFPAMKATAPIALDSNGTGDVEHIQMVGWKPSQSSELGLRHWVNAVNNSATALLRRDPLVFGNAPRNQWLTSETLETEPRIAALVRSINTLNALVT